MEVLSHVVSIGASAPYDGRRRSPRTCSPSTPARCARSTGKPKNP
ncbi:chorismate synthase domain protein [Mycobacterium ulcerans str. Harvey]|uniref:Chorismate synthase domain protein n=1 Tax=Mycobacterium ulcerans str. Harvey TaxID=1299332 RepID=A0ABP3AII5_MYCUL|nr:chorismate synthase domain protein [Mycobacterium ulcerans str. Harvey]